MKVGIYAEVPQDFEEYVRKFKREGHSENMAMEKAAMACADRGLPIPGSAVKKPRKRFFEDA